MLIRLERPAPAPSYEDGEDDQVVAAPAEPRYAAVNPLLVAAVFESRHPGVCVVKMADGRGILVVGSFEEVMIRLTHEHDVALNAGNVN